MESGGRDVGNRAKRIALAVISFAMLSACTTAKPGTRFHYYSVYAEDHAGLYRSVRSYAPRGGRAYGLTEITFIPLYEPVQDGEYCRPKNVSVELALEITLPKWRDGKDIARAVHGRFRNFERYIRAHELHHASIAKRYAAMARRKISAMRASGGCGRLRTEISQYLTQLKRLHLAAHKAYDKREARRLKTLLPEG